MESIFPHHLIHNGVVLMKSINPDRACPFERPDAAYLWHKMCAFHRKKNLKHKCGNPDACEERFMQGWSMELIFLGWD